MGNKFVEEVEKPGNIQSDIGSPSNETMEGGSSENQVKVADIKEELPKTINTCSAIVAEKGADVTEQGPVVIKSGQPHPDTKKQAAVLKKAARDVAHELEKQLKDLKELEMQHQ